MVVVDEGQADVMAQMVQLLDRLALLERRVQEQDKFLLTFRQSQLIMLGASEEILHLPRTVEPKHRRRN